MKPVRRISFILLGLILLFRCQSGTVLTYKLNINNNSITVELADDEESRAKGLKYRTSLAPDYGMLFAYPDEKMMNFWMKDTSIPLSIAFIKSDSVILEIMDMEPFNTENIHSTAPAQYALETARGWFRDNQIKAGDKVIFPSALKDYLQTR